MEFAARFRARDAATTDQSSLIDMDDWFERLVKDVIWKGIQDAVGELAGEASSAIEGKLATLTVGQKLSSSPLVAVVAVDSSSVTLLVRGRFKLFGGAAAPFVRLQVKVSKQVDDQLDPPIEIIEWQTVVGDLQIQKEGVFSAELGFGYDQGAWLGRGAFKVVPAGFGLDLLLGGLDERGLMVGIDVDLPAPIPLGSSGVVLTGLGGDFAYNFVARLNAGVPKPQYDATDYVAWAKDQSLDRWIAGPPTDTAVGVGLRADLGDITTMGWLLKLEPIGLAVLTPGPVFILGGKGKLINTNSIKVEGYVAVDIGSESMALGLDLRALEPESGNFKFLDAHGSVDAFFSFQRPSDWYLRFGTSKSPIAAKVLEALDADVFLMVGHGAVPHPDGTTHDGVFFGVGIAFGDTWKAWIVEVTAKIGARAALAVGWNPLELGGAFAIYGELGLKIWEFGLKIVLALELTGYIAEPTKLTGDVHWSLDLPWPIPDIDGTLAYSLGDSGGPPELKSPLLLGSGA
jgi:hypothetical protein